MDLYSLFRITAVLLPVYPINALITHADSLGGWIDKKKVLCNIIKTWD